MKRILALIAVSLLATTAHAQVTSQKLMSAGMSAQLAEQVAAIGTGGTVINNATWLKGRNAADSADINWMRISSGDDTVFNSSASDDLLFQLEDDAQRIIGMDAGSDAALRVFWGDGGTTAVQILTIASGNADADDDSSLILTGAGAYASDGTRGASIVLPGEEVAGGSDMTLNVGTSDTFIFNVAGTLATTISSTALTAAGLVSSTGLQFPTANEEAVAGAGTTVADAGALSATKHVHQLTGANGTVGWKFATSVAGQFEFLLNTTAGVPKIYAASGGTCNGGAADAACTLVTGIVAHLCYSTAADTWICA